MDVPVERFDKWPMPLDDPSKDFAISPMHKFEPPRQKKNPPMDKVGWAKCIEEMVREEIRLVEAISILKMLLVDSSSAVFMVTGADPPPS